jgi:O-antigen/teichoic acid export membrane protein
MIKSLMRNMLISALAFFTISVVGLLLVPILISTYGIHGFGLISIARLFLPLAALAILDIGFGEIATHSVATARVDSDWKRCSRILLINIVSAVMIGLVAGILLWVLTPHIGVWMKVPSADWVTLSSVLYLTAVLLPIFFSSLVFEGVLKGYENFAMQRLSELISTLTYAAMVILVAHLELGLEWVCYSFLLSLLIRFSFATMIAIHHLKRNGVSISLWMKEDSWWFGGRAKVMSQNKILGAIQSSAPSLLIGTLIGPSGLGLYEALSRMPKFAKSVFGLLNSTIQPVAVRLESMVDDKNISRLGRLGLQLMATIIASFLGALVSMSEPILRLWLGASVAPYWKWQAVYFIVPALSSLVGLGGSALLARKHAIEKMNRIGALYLSLVLLVGIVAIDALQERAFIAAQVIAIIVTFPIQMNLIRREMNIDTIAYVVLVKIFSVAIIMSIPTIWVATYIDSIPVLLTALVSWIVTCWAICASFAIEPQQRTQILQKLMQNWNAGWKK